MSYINQIVEDGVTYDIAAKNLVNGFTQTTPGVNALDAAAGKSLNDSLANLSTDVSTNYATKTDLANLSDIMTSLVPISLTDSTTINSILLEVSDNTPRLFYCSAAVSVVLTNNEATHSGRGYLTRGQNAVDFLLSDATTTTYQGRYNISTGAVSSLRKFNYT